MDWTGTGLTVLLIVAMAVAAVRHPSIRGMHVAIITAVVVAGVCAVGIGLM